MSRRILLPGDAVLPISAARPSPAPPPPPPPPDLSRFAALVPFQDSILHPVEDALRGLERLGVPVVRRPGSSAIDYVRSEMASQALAEGKEAILFVDSDVLFNPRDAVRLLLRPEPIVAGVYAQKRFSKLNVNVFPDLEEIRMGDIGKDYEVKGVGAGFLRIRSEALIRVVEHFDMPCCTATGSAVWPIFLPMVEYDDDAKAHVYVCEDMAFCYRARAAGMKVIADTRVNLYHLGLYPYSFIEAAKVKPERASGVAIPVYRPDDDEDA
jgi:hypothetical protein